MVSEPNPPRRKQRLIELTGWLIGFIWLTFIFPSVMIIMLPTGQRPGALATWAANPFLEYLSISVGIGLGLNPLLSFLLTLLPCTGLAMLVMGLLGFLGDSSARVASYKLKIQMKIDKYPRIKKYGVASNFFFIMILGVYISPGISIIMGWSRVRSIIFMAGGISLITALIGFATMGIIDLFFV